MKKVVQVVIVVVKNKNVTEYMEEMKTQLPDNAFRELKEGEKYEPMMSPQGQ
jgi:hypothetical protein